MNIFVASGNLTRDPEQRSVGDKTVTTFSIAVNYGFGENKKVFFPRISVWGNRGSAITRFCRKGSKVTVRGELYLHEYTASDGEKRFSLEVRADEVDINFDSRSGESGAPAPAKPAAPPADQNDEDDELPF